MILGSQRNTIFWANIIEQTIFASFVGEEMNYMWLDPELPQPKDMKSVNFGLNNVLYP
jgi:hypothetical protein